MKDDDQVLIDEEAVAEQSKPTKEVDQKDKAESCESKVQIPVIYYVPLFLFLRGYRSTSSISNLQIS